MASDTMKQRWFPAFAMFCMLAAAASGTSEAQQTAAPQRQETHTAERIVHPAGSEAAAQDNPPVEVVAQIGHSAGVISVAFSSDGRSVLSAGGMDHTVKLWDVATGRLVRTFLGHSADVTGVAFSPDGSKVLSGSWDKTLKLWDAAAGQLLHTFEGHSDAVNSVAFSPDGSKVLSGGRDNTIKLWDAATGQLLATFAGHSDMVKSVAFSPDGSKLASGGSLFDKTHS